ncbi:MAG: hypothetical protein CVV17_08560, partial [Gammaproteobacteria bacterium HGW-Gammaproteobacteria-7]
MAGRRSRHGPGIEFGHRLGPASGIVTGGDRNPVELGRRDQGDSEKNEAHGQRTATLDERREQRVQIALVEAQPLAAAAFQ